MLTRFFDQITRLSLKLNWLTVIFALIMLVLGFLAYRGLNQELVPRVEFPQTIIVAQWSDAEDAEDFLQQVTIPLEDQLQQVEGVVNVESTTNPTLAFIIVRNEFGLNQSFLSEEIEAAVADTELPEGMEFPQVLNFNLSDLPIVTVSLSSSELTLSELKQLVEDEILVDLQDIDEVNQVAVSGGQELPDEESAVAEADTDPVPTAQPTATPEPTADPAQLPDILVQGLESAGFDVTTAGDITPELMRQLTGIGPAATQGLALLTPGNLRALDPEVIALLPSDFVADLDGTLRAELDQLAADFGGAAALYEAELAAAEEEEEASETAAAVIEPQALPNTWVTALESVGVTLSTTADVTDEIARGIAQESPALLAELEPAQWRALPPETLAIFLPAAGDTLEPQLAAQLSALATFGTGETPAPVELPPALVEASTDQGFVLETTADLTPEVIGPLASLAPELLESLTPEMLLALSPESLAELPDGYLEMLDPGLEETVGYLIIYGAAESAPVVAAEPAFDPQPLPESWIAATDLATTADITPEVMGGIAEGAPVLLEDLTPEQWRALSPAVVEIALPALPSELELDRNLLAQLEAIRNAAQGVLPDPQPLPEELMAAAASAGQTLESTADLTPQIVQAIGQLAPELFDAFPPELLVNLTPDVLAAFPDSYLETLEPGLQQTVTNVIVAAEAFEAVQAEEAVEAEPEAEPMPAPDPARLPDLLIQGAEQFGLEIEFAGEITPDFMRTIGGLGPQSEQILGLLTPGNLRALQPEVIALLPPSFVDGLESELRAELDELAADFGGAGKLAAQEAAEAEAQAVGAPALSGVWIEPSPEGEPSQFQTAADILNNAFLPSAAQFINVFPESADVENPAQWMFDLTPDVIAWIAEREEGFVENLSPIVLELMSPETLSFMLENYPDAFDAELTARLESIALGEVEAFVPEASITRTNGDPALILSFFKAGDANTVVVAERVFDALEEATSSSPLEYQIVFEQASFVEDAISGVFGEMLRGGLFAILVILLFLSGRVQGRYRLSWRAVLIIGISIPASVLTAFVLMRWIPPLIGAPISDWANSTNSESLRFIAQLFPSEFTLNILTLSGLTVAIGRVVDDSIVVLENSYRYIQQGMAPAPATIKATREVAVAIFSATFATMAVFLPLGLVGGLISSFFLPFGLTVAYALAASFGVAITIVPVLIVLFIRRENIPEHREDTVMLRGYTPILEWCLNHRLVTVLLALLLFAGSLVLLAQLPQSFLPELGEPTVNATVELPAGTRMAETDERVREFESVLLDRDGVVTAQTEIGSGGGVEAFFGGGGVSQNVANVSIAVEDRFFTEQEALGTFTAEIRRDAESVFGQESVTVSTGTIASFGNALELVLTGLPEGITLEEEAELVADVKEAIGSVDVDGNGDPDVVNVTSNIDDALAGGSASIIRIDGQPAISFSGEYEFGTSNTIGITEQVQQEITALDSLPAGVEVGEGFDSQQQSEGFEGVINAIAIASVLVYLVMALSFRSLVHPFTILFSLPLSLIGSAVALYITDRVLGISSMVGLLMLVGLVTTNGIVLMVLVQQLKDEQSLNTYDALIQGGRTRLRPIWMTALATILALVPLALSDEAGAIIAADLAWTVLGGMLVGTVLTLVVIPVIYSMLDQMIARVKGAVGRGSAAAGD